MSPAAPSSVPPLPSPPGIARIAPGRCPVPQEARERALAISTRSGPPRLAHVLDQTGDVAVYRLAGPRSLGVAEAATLPLPPAPGRVVATLDTRSEVAHAPEGAPFTLQITVPAAEAETLSDRLAATGAL